VIDTPLNKLWAFFSSKKWTTSKKAPLAFNDNLQGRAVGLAIDAIQRPSVAHFYRMVKLTVDIGGFANCKASILPKLHPDLDVNLAKLWRRGMGERSNLSPFPRQFEFLKKFLPFHYLFEKYGDVIHGLPGLPLTISDTEAQEIAMLLQVLPSWIRVTIKRIYIQYFAASKFDLTLNKLMKRRKQDTVARITGDVRTIYNMMVRQKRILAHRSTSAFESMYDCSIRLATLLIRGTTTLESVIAAHKVMLYAQDNKIETVCAKLTRLQEFLEDVAIGLDLSPITDFLEQGKYEFDSITSNHQSDPIPPLIIASEIRRNLFHPTNKHLQIRAASTSLLASFGTRIGCQIHFKRANYQEVGFSALCQFFDSKTKKAGATCQRISVPYYDHMLSPDRAMKVLDDIIGKDRVFTVGYVPATQKVCPKNFRAHTEGSMKHLITAIISDAPANLRGLIVDRKKITPNTWRFTAEAIRAQAEVSERSRIHAKQHKPKNQTEHYALTTEEVLGFGKKLQEFWEKQFQKLAHSAALRAASKRGKPLQTYGQRRKKRKIQSGLAVSV